MKCEKCQSEHDGSYGSGRFCNVRCARSFSSFEKRAEINEKVSQKLKGDIRCAWNKGKHLVERNTRTCLICIQEFTTLSSKSQQCCSKSCGSKLVTRRTGRERMLKAYRQGRHVSGGVTKWYDYDSIRVQGTFELRTCRILDRWQLDNVIQSWEYTKDRISYLRADGTEHLYLLDFKIKFHDGTFSYLEVKGFMREHDAHKWKAVRDQGFNLMVWFEENIKSEEIRLKLEP